MSVVLPEAASTTDEPLASFLFDYPGADIILRSQDAHLFRVPKIYIENSSSVLSELIRKALDSPSAENVDASLPVVHLPKRGDIIHCLLTFIFPVIPLLPSTLEEVMELLSDSLAYQMGSVLSRIRDRIARSHPLPTHLEPTLRIYSIAQEYGLRLEALQTARTALNYPMTIEGFDNKLDIMSGPSLYELWKYHEKVRVTLASDLTEFRESGARGTMSGIRCLENSSSQIPLWLDQYIESIGNAPNLFDSVEFNVATTRHIKQTRRRCECTSIPGQTIRDFWEALASVVRNGFEKAETALSLVHELELELKYHPTQIDSKTPPLEPFDIPDANLIIRSSDFVDFRVHKPVLAMASSVFTDLFSLPQPSDSEFDDELPVVKLSEDSELLRSLVSIIYPVPTVIPNSHEKVLYLLAACQKYDMVSAQSFIRTEVSRGGFPVPTGVEAFAAYAIASGKKLIPEMEHAARQTLKHPMTFEILGERLRLFEAWALRDLAGFRKRCRDNLVACFESFSKLGQPPFNIWIPCTDDSYSISSDKTGYSPAWLNELFQKHLKDSREAFSKPLFNPRSIRGEYLSALKAHLTSINCVSCTKVHSLNGESFCKALEDRLTWALSEVCAILTHPG